MSKQQTIAASFTLKGKGLHTGENVNLTLLPAPENTGYLVRRIDLDGENEIPLLAENIISTDRSTVVACGNAKISTVEHCLSALYAMGIDNCIMEVDAPEFPILDGSAKYFAEGIEKAGITVQNADRDYFEVTHKMTFTSADGNTTITLLPDTEFSVQTMIGYDSLVLSNQYAMLDSMNNYKNEIASCRTFVFIREIIGLFNAGLIKGGDLDNALLIYDRETDNETLANIAKMLGREAPDVKQLGYINGPLQYTNEPARHKLLDLIGDLALIGKPLKARVIAVHPGHKANAEFTKKLRKTIRKQDVFMPHINEEAQPVLDINQIKGLLPHRYPFLLVDKVMDMTESQIVAIKNVTFNEMHFIGHFPDEPVMPGVLQVEAMAQSAGLMVLSQMDDPKLYSTYFLSINNVKFRNKVVPGDTLVMRVFLTSPIRRGLASIKGYSFVNGHIATEAEFVAQIIKN